MPSKRQLFLANVAQTSEMPMGIDISHAEGIHIYDNMGQRYYDMNSGISVSSVGHRHPQVVKALRDQLDRYMHTMVYGEHIQSPQVSYATKLLSHMADQYESLYYLMSGTEATELAMKIIKRYTGRYEIVCARHAYHGSTQGAESLRSDADYLASYLPLLPDIRHIDYNSLEDLQHITERTAGVIIEGVQGEAGVNASHDGYLQAVADRCREVGALLVLDEIQTGFGRTGYLFAHQRYDILPDIVLIGKAMGGGMPIAGVVSSRDIMNCIVKNPALGHITTFGGHPMSCVAAEAALDIITGDNLIDEVEQKAALIKHRLSSHAIIKEVRHVGLMMAVETTKKKYLKHVVGYAQRNGVLIDWFLFNDRSFRLAPPLIISNEEIMEATAILLEAFDFAQEQYDR